MEKEREKKRQEKAEIVGTNNAKRFKPNVP